MEENTKIIFDSAYDSMEQSVKHLQKELSKIRAGRATTSILDGIMVNYYDTPTPIQNIASLSTPDARTILVQPWEKPILPEIIKSINSSNLGFLAQDTGDKIIINLPILTEERRKELVKQVKSEAELCKVSIRNLRRDANEELKKLNKSGLSDDELKSAEEKVQFFTDEQIKKVDTIFVTKEKDILTV